MRKCFVNTLLPLKYRNRNHGFCIATERLRVLKNVNFHFLKHTIAVISAIFVKLDFFLVFETL